MNNNKGSIIVIALLMISIILLLTHHLIRNVYVGSHFIQTMINRQKAEMLAHGGLTIAIAELNHKDSPKAVSEFILRTLPHLNRWQTFQLHENIDGIEGQVKICISSEDGKINLNEIFDFKKQEFKKEYDQFLKNLEIPGKLKPGEVHARLLEYLKKRQRKLDDITELSAIDGFKHLDIFYSPPLPPMTKKEKFKPNETIAIQDLFTTWTKTDKINALWLSDALCGLFGFDRPMAHDAQRKKEAYKKIAETIKSDMANDWNINWNILQPIYGTKPKPELMNALKNIFSKEFETKVYSVLSYGKVGQAEETLLAIIKRVKKDEESGSDEHKSINKPKESFKILRLYWL